ncbi:conserved hypothetical protein [Hydrogenobaculum sp. Y04AAS1]|uniref:DUF3501 family protein n=1 Tax=Hydrogenobaculum sp. (strain Y04AAS1) TaxID=380749 RepID=UPI00015BCF73|nr:conserved hypothetical protein [Hydrogenobaculum sp. Y04AAS1]HCT66150.1 DUF3501 domain-containing protein [Hydrogenobaculum sp.]
MKKINYENILNLYEYEKARPEKVKELLGIKKKRSIFAGDIFHLFFENTFSVWFQIQEMIRAERMVKDEDINFEIEVYNDLIPEQNQLSATLFIEIPDENERKRKLKELVGIHDGIFISFKDQKIKAKANEQSDMDYKFGKAATIHFIKFDFDNHQKELFKNEKAFIEINHKDINIKQEIPQEVKEELVKDLYSE